MRTLDADALAPALPSTLRSGDPRVVVTGNHATPMTTLALLDAALPSYRLFALNARADLPLRDGVTPETCFVGPGMRRHPRLHYVPARLSLAPRLFHTTLVPDVVLLPVEGRGNLVLAATRPPARPIREGLATLDPAGELAVRYREHGVDLAEIAASAVLEPDYIGPVQQAGVVLTDDFAPVETLDRERVPAILPPSRGRG